ncbi:hypothetical protein N0V88_008212 [Collariella sp. IMI 366227]|nr:hypothetical protein N0V88_008212 [Collariella sp. IMI 366227]
MGLFSKSSTSGETTPKGVDEHVHETPVHGDVEVGELQENKYAYDDSRKLGITGAVFLILNKMIGTGIFSTPSSIFAATGSVGVSLMLWVIGGLLTFCGLSVWLEFGLAIPRSGGEKNYLERIYRHPRYLATCVPFRIESGEGYGGGGAYAYSNALLNIVYSYKGWENANYVLGEIRDPRRTLTIAAPLAVGGVTILYVLANVAYFAAIPKADLATSEVIVAGLFFKNVFGDSAGARSLPAFVALSNLGNVLAVSFAHARLNQELGKEGLLPLSRVWGSNKPFNSLPQQYKKATITPVQNEHNLQLRAEATHRPPQHPLLLTSQPSQPPTNLTPSTLGTLSASLTSFARTIDEYHALAKQELNPAKQEKAFERIRDFRAELVGFRAELDALKRAREEAQHVENRSELLGRRPFAAATDWGSGVGM